MSEVKHVPDNLLQFARYLDEKTLGDFARPSQSSSSHMR